MEDNSLLLNYKVIVLLNKISYRQMSVISSLKLCGNVTSSPPFLHDPCARRVTMVDVTTANKVLSSDLFVYTYF